MSATWKTKWGPRRVRQDLPTLAEAIAAAQGLTDDVDQQVEIAAMLMGVDVAEALVEAKKLGSERGATLTVVAPTRDRGPRTVVVERRSSRRLVPRDVAVRDMPRSAAPSGSRLGLRSR